MSDRDGSDGRIKRDARDATVSTHDAKTGRAESWQAGPSNKNLSMLEYSRRIHKRTDCRIATGPERRIRTRRPRAVLPHSRLRETLYTRSFVHCSKLCSMFKDNVYREIEREETGS